MDTYTSLLRALRVASMEGRVILKGSYDDVKVSSVILATIQIDQ